MPTQKKIDAVADLKERLEKATIIVGTDGSATAEMAVRHASELAKDHQARLVIVTAYEPHDDSLAKHTEGVPDDILSVDSMVTQACDDTGLDSFGDDPPGEGPAA